MWLDSELDECMKFLFWSKHGSVLFFWYQVIVVFSLHLRAFAKITNLNWQLTVFKIILGIIVENSYKAGASGFSLQLVNSCISQRKAAYSFTAEAGTKWWLQQIIQASPIITWWFCSLVHHAQFSLPWLCHWSYGASVVSRPAGVWDLFEVCGVRSQRPIWDSIRAAWPDLYSL